MLKEYSTHPIAKTIVNYAKVKSIQAKSGAEFKNRAGKGIQATIDHVPYFGGNIKLFEEVNTPIDHHLEEILRLQRRDCQSNRFRSWRESYFSELLPEEKISDICAPN